MRRHSGRPAESRVVIPMAKEKALVQEQKPSGELQIFREFEHAMLDMERRMDRVLRDAFGGGRSLWDLPIIQGLTMQRGPDGKYRFQPFGHLQESLDRFLEGWRAPVLTWNVDEDRNRIEFRAEVPGLKKGDLKVDVRPDGIAIEGDSKGTRYRAECRPGMTLNPDGAKARCDDGVLNLSVPLAEPARPQGRRVPIE